MKKLFALIMVFSMLFSVAVLISGCDEKIVKKPSSNRDDDDDDDDDDDSTSSSGNGENKPKFDEETVLSQLTVEEYRYHNGDIYYSVLSFENLSDYDARILVTVNFFDASNKLITEKTGFVDLGSGGKNVVELYIETEFARIEYTLSTREPVFDYTASELSCESVTANGIEIVTVTNEGEKRITGIEATGVFWKNGEIVDVNSLSIPKLEPGKSKSVEMYLYVKEFDSVDFYLSGIKSSVEPVKPGDFDEEAVVSCLSVEEYRYQADGKYYSVLLVENSSDYDLTITADVRFYSAGNKLFSAEERNAQCIGSNEKTVFWFSQTEEFARIEYDLSAEKSNQNSAVSDLTWESLKGNKKEIVTVTNIGEKTVADPSCTMLFWNNGSLVHIEEVNFRTLQPGKSATMDVSCDKVYDVFEIYWSSVESDVNYDPLSEDVRNQVLSNLKVEEYRYERYNSHYGVLVVENPTDINVVVSLAVRFYNDSNKLIGADYKTIYYNIANGGKTVFEFSQPEKFARLEYECFVSGSTNSCAVADLAWAVDYENKTISVTNESDKEISSPHATIIFWREDKIVYVGTEYFFADDHSFDPGDTITDTYYCYEDHDSLQVYWSALYY